MDGAAAQVQRQGSKRVRSYCCSRSLWARSAASRTRGRGCWHTHRQASPPSRDPGICAATQHFMSPASSAKPFEWAAGLFNVAVPDTASATGVRWLKPAGCRCQLRQWSYEGCMDISVLYILVFGGFSLSPSFLLSRNFWICWTQHLGWREETTGQSHTCVRSFLLLDVWSVMALESEQL